MDWLFTPKIAEAIRSEWHYGDWEGRLVAVSIVLAYVTSIIGAITALVQAII